VVIQDRKKREESEGKKVQKKRRNDGRKDPRSWLRIKGRKAERAREQKEEELPITLTCF
jgi:hypothetical protein